MPVTICAASQMLKALISQLRSRCDNMPRS
jgi:hypothetical protein